MRFLLLFICCTVISVSASAQWWKVGPLKKQDPNTEKVKVNPPNPLWWQVGPLKKYRRFPSIARLSDNSIKRLPIARPHKVKALAPLLLKNSDYYLELAEALTIKTAQRNMRYHVYDSASYNFSELAKLYVQQNRLSEAKWYLLQSSNLSRQQNDFKHTIANLMSLAMVKYNLGDSLLAQQDLTEARQIALTNGWKANAVEIQKESTFIQKNKTATTKTELRYADAIPAADKKAADKKTD